MRVGESLASFSWETTWQLESLFHQDLKAAGVFKGNALCLCLF